jgi:hypothetical protein
MSFPDFWAFDGKFRGISVRGACHAKTNAACFGEKQRGRFQALAVISWRPGPHRCGANGTRGRFLCLAAVRPLKNCHHFRMSSVGNGGR